MRLFTFPWNDMNAARIFANVAAQPYSLFFDSARPGHPANLYSYICFAPFEMIESKNGKVTVTNREQQLSFHAGPFSVLKERIEIWGMGREAQANLPPFQGGAAGFFGYDLAREIERLPETSRDSSAMPDMAVGLYDQVLAFDHGLNKAWFMAQATSQKEAEKKF